MNPDRYLRTFDVLNLLVQHRDGLRLTEIKAALGLPVSSVHDMLQTMVSAEVATVTDDLRYQVGPRTVALALRTLQSLDVRTIARRHLQDLVKTIGDNVYLAMHVGKRIIYADRCLGTQRVSLGIRLGEPCTCTVRQRANSLRLMTPGLRRRHCPAVGPSSRRTPSLTCRSWNANSSEFAPWDMPKAMKNRSRASSVMPFRYWAA